MGLYHLSPAHLAAVLRHERIQRHVLRLERRHANSLLQENPAQRRRQHALARVGTGALDHQRLGSNGFRHRAMPRLQDGGQGLAQPIVLRRRAHGNPEESLVQILPRAERPDRNAVLQQAVRQLQSVHTRAIQPHQQKVRHAGVDVQSRDPHECFGQPATLAVHQRHGPPGVVVVSQQGHGRLLRQNADRPRRNLTTDSPNRRCIRDGEAQPQTRNRVEFRQRTHDDAVGLQGGG